MNWIHLLKNKSGKLVMSTQKALIISAGVGIVGATLMQNLVMPSDSQDMQVRSLASVSNNFDYSGMRQSADRTGLTSISVSDESGTFKAAQGTIPAGDFGLKGADNLDAKVSSAFDGKGGALSDTEGLGKSRDVDLSQTAGVNGQSGKNAPSRRSYSPRGGNSGTDDSYSSSASGRTAEPTQIASLGSASMAHASGSGINASYGDFSSGSSSSSGSRGSSSRTSGGKSSGSSYNFSGAMPGGTNPVSLSGADGRSSSRFAAGAVNASVSRGSQSGSLKSELKDISKRSADAATLAGRGDASNTEGARAFLASSQQSGGLNIESGTDADTGATSSDFKNPTTPQLAGIKNWANDTNDFLTKKEKAFAGVVALMIATLIALVAGMWAISYLAKPATWGWALAITGVVLGIATWAFIAARNYYLDYGRDGWVPPVTWSLSGLVIAGLGFAWASAYLLKKNVVKEFFQKRGKELTKKVVHDGLGMGGNALKNVTQSELNSDTQTDNKK